MVQAQPLEQVVYLRLVANVQLVRQAEFDEVQGPRI